MKAFAGAARAASKLLGIALLAAACGSGRALACTPDALGNSGAGAYAVQSSGVLEAVQAQSANPFSMSSIAVNVYQVTATAQLDVAFYSDAGGAPGSLLAQSSSGPQTAVVGWNTFSMPALTYSAGTYWLAFQASTSFVWFSTDFSVSPTVNTTQNNPFGTFPATWSGSGFNDFLWSDYAQICYDTPSPTPTLSLTPNPSFTASATPSFTASPTGTHSPSPTGTSTGTATPTATWTPSPLPSATGTGTPVASATSTRSPSPSPRPSKSPTATPTPAPSLTPACASGLAWPNPFTPTLGTNQAVQFCVPPGHPGGTLMVYNLQRRLIRSIAFGVGQPVVWDGRDGQGSVVLFGVYPFLLQSGGRVDRGAVTVLR